MEDLWYYAVDGKDSRGPFPRVEMFQLASAGIIQPETLVWNCQYSQWVSFAVCFGSADSSGVTTGRTGCGPSSNASSTTHSHSYDEVANQIANFEIASLVLWGLLALLQIFIIEGTTVTIVGFYNALMVTTHSQYVPWIRKRRKSVVSVYDNVFGLVIAGLANLFFGAYLGVFLIGFDFYIRHLILKNRAVFNNS